MVAQYDQLHMVNNNPTKFEQILLIGFKGVDSINCDEQKCRHQYNKMYVTLHVTIADKTIEHFA